MKINKESLIYFDLRVIYICTTRFKNLRYNSFMKIVKGVSSYDFPVFLIRKCFMLDVKGFLDSSLQGIH